MAKPASFAEARAQVLAAEAAVANDRVDRAVEEGWNPLVIAQLSARSTLASLDAAQAADRLASSPSHRGGASDVC